MADSVPREVAGFYITNSTYAALSMENGDAFAKKFGGDTGDDPDYFKLVVLGYNNGVYSDSAVFYLADFRFDDNRQDYIIRDWRWFDLSGLGEVDSLHFNLFSSDIGSFGMNTPAYFCMDNLYYQSDLAGPILAKKIPNLEGEAGNSKSLSLDGFFVNADSTAVEDIRLLFNTDATVATASIAEGELTVDFLNPGQTNLILMATSQGKSLTDTLAIGTRPALQGDFVVADFEGLPVGAGGFYNGVDGAGGFTSGPANFPNEFNPDFGSWNGWAYSNVNDITTPGFLNQYAAITGAGLTNNGTEGSQYGVSFHFGNTTITFEDNKAQELNGFFVTNSTYAALSMQNGDAFAKKFGGETGNDPDFFKLMAWGYQEGEATDTVSFYLADYRFEDNAKDYIIQTWQWIDLSSFDGKIDSLSFALTSSDVGQFGMNTPAYFCMDDLYFQPGIDGPRLAKQVPNVEGEVGNSKSISLDGIFVNADKTSVEDISVLFNSDTTVATASIAAGELNVNFLNPGQTNLILKATNQGKSVTDTLAIGTRPALEEGFVSSDFEGLPVGDGGFYNGADGAGGFVSGLANFPNDFNPDFGSWNGWAYSNVNDNTTPGFFNQYAAITGTGLAIDGAEGTQYGVSFHFGNTTITFKDDEAHEVGGFFITNSTYAALSMQNGDAFAKKFGGETGNDPDFFKLMAWGYQEGEATDTVSFYLADYRFEDNAKDYIIQTWQWVDLSSFDGKIDSLSFALASSDVGDFGINTPQYFCMDQLQIKANPPVLGLPDLARQQPQVYPNPTRGTLYLNLEDSNPAQVRVYCPFLRQIFWQKHHHFA